MPKNRKVIKTQTTIKKVNVKNKLRIGTRKTGTTACGMTNQKLREVLKDDNKRKWHQNARVVLKQRGL